MYTLNAHNSLQWLIIIDHSRGLGDKPSLSLHTLCLKFEAFIALNFVLHNIILKMIILSQVIYPFSRKMGISSIGMLMVSLKVLLDVANLDVDITYHVHNMIVPFAVTIHEVHIIRI